MVKIYANRLNITSEPSLPGNLVADVNKSNNNKSDDNNTDVRIGNDNNNNDNKNSKYKYVKVVVKDPYNNRDIILKVTKKQKGIGETVDGKNKPTLDPLFVTGFTDAEGSFMAKVNKNSRCKTGWVVSANFTKILHLEDLPLLVGIQKFFGGVGFITKDFKRNQAYFTVVKLCDIINVIIPHFNSYPLLSKKQLDFIL